MLEKKDFEILATLEALFGFTLLLVSLIMFIREYNVMDSFHTSLTDMKSQVNVAVINKTYEGPSMTV